MASSNTCFSISKKQTTLKQLVRNALNTLNSRLLDCQPRIYARRGEKHSADRYCTGNILML